MTKKITKNYSIVLDTNQFGDTNKYNFKESKVTICAESFKSFSNIDIYIPSIVYEELKKNIRDSINNSEKQIKSVYLKKGISEEFIKSIYNGCVEQLDNFIKKNRIKIIDCDKYSNITEVNAWYFNGEMPFEPEKPKEFPDALIISSIKNYFEENKYDNVYIISNDKGFSSGITEHTRFKIKSDIVDIMQELLDISEVEIRNCKNYIKKENIISDVNTFDIISDDPNDYFDVSDITYEINSFEILSKVIDNSVVVVTNCNLVFKGEFKIVNQDISYYDHDDPECSVIFCNSGNEIVINDYDVFIELETDKTGTIIDYSIIYIDPINLSKYVYQLPCEC